MTEKARNTARELRRTLRILLVATVILYLGGIGLGLYTLSIANNNNDALCSLRNNYVFQNTVSRDFLRDHPNGNADFTVAQIKQTMRNRVAIIRALDNGDCKPPIKEILNGDI